MNGKRIHRFAFTFILGFCLLAQPVAACTIFMASLNGAVLFGNNEKGYHRYLIPDLFETSTSTSTTSTSSTTSSTTSTTTTTETPDYTLPLLGASIGVGVVVGIIALALVRKRI